MNAPLAFAALATAVQIAAATVAVRLMLARREWGTWSLVAAAFALMAVRRALSLGQALGFAERVGPGGATSEALALVISGLLLLGVLHAGRALALAERAATDARLSETATRERARTHRLLVEAVPVGMALLRGGRIVFANRTLGGLLDRDEAELAGQDLGGFMPPDQARDLEAFLAAGPPADSSVLLNRRWSVIRRDGGRRWCSLRWRQVDWDGGGATLMAVIDVTEWHAAIAALEESEAKFRALTESAASAIFIFEDERMLYVNPRAEEISGYSRDELLRMRFWEVIDPALQPLVRDRGISRLRGESVPQRYQVKLRRRDGSGCWVDFTAARVEFGARPIVIGTAYDVTELKQAEEELRRHHDHLEDLVRQRTAQLQRSEETFRALAENSVDTIMRFDRAHRHLYANPIVESQTGIPAAEFIGRTHAELGFPPELVELWATAIDGVFATGSPNRIEFRLPTGIWIDWQLIPEFSPEGEVLSVVTTARDITERKHVEEELRRHRDHLEDLVEARAGELSASNAALRREIAERLRVEGALRESEARFRSLYDNVAIGLYRTTPEGRVMMANPALVRMLGFASFEELASHNLATDPSLYVDAPRSRFVEMMERDGEIRGLESALRRRDGEIRWVRETATAKRDESGAVVYYEGALEDVTATRRLEEQLRQLQKMQAIGHLAGGVAHDFNNLLMAMTGPVEMLQHRLGAEDPAQRDLEIIHRAARRAADLTRGLLAFASRQVLAPRVIDLNEVVREMLPMLRRVIPENIGLDFAPAPEPMAISADRGQIEQVLMNLCLNSRDAMPSGGVISVSTGRVAADAALRAAHPGAEAGSYALLTLRDTGSGMDAATLERVFEPFFSTKGPGRGTGMGLATVYGIVRQHAGFIDLESAPGQGTTCRVYLPEIAATVADGAAAGAGAAVRGSETVLVCEDDPEVRGVIVAVLGSLGYEVIEAGDGSAALAVLGERGDAIDLVITDVIMPHMGGAELFRAARRLGSRARFLFSSGYAESALDGALLAERGTAFIAKPYGIDALSRTVRQLLDGAS